MNESAVRRRHPFKLYKKTVLINVHANFVVFVFTNRVVKNWNN